MKFAAATKEVAEKIWKLYQAALGTEGCTWSSEYPNRKILKNDMELIMTNREKELELYIHIPFCVQKCYYCDFLSMPVDETVRRHYVNQLIREIEQKAEYYRDYNVTSVFLGGGTPSILEGNQTAEIMEALQQNFTIEKDAEITIECNPGTLNRQKLSAYKNAGINRISMGLQSANNQELKNLGRIHTFEEFLQNYDLVRKTGFENVNVDLMSALPGQKVSDWERTLKEVLKLRPEHISAYSLIIEEGTPFYQKYEEDEMRREAGECPLILPTEEAEREMYFLAKKMLLEKGYERYEISNYAKKGKECRHNIGYWTRKNYLGLGLGSASLVENVRFSNTSDLNEYLNGKFEPEEREVLARKEQMEEFAFLGLRMMSGINRKEFVRAFGVEIEAVFGEVIQKMIDKGLLLQQAGNIFLTEEGISVSNYVMSEFLLE